MKWYDRTLVVLCLMMLFSIAKQQGSIIQLLSSHNQDQNRYSAVANEFAKSINNTITRAQLDIARIDDRWEKQRQEEEKFKKQAEMFELQLRKLKEARE